MEKVACQVKEKGWHPVFSIAPGLKENKRIMMKEHLEAKNFDIYTGPGRDLLAASACAAAASGTVAAEAMMLGCYVVVTYKLSSFSALVARLLVKTQYFTIPNILLNAEIFPELMQSKATTENMFRETMKWLRSDDKTKAEKVRQIDLARKMLGETGVYEKLPQYGQTLQVNYILGRHDVGFYQPKATLKWIQGVPKSIQEISQELAIQIKSNKEMDTILNETQLDPIWYTTSTLSIRIVSQHDLEKMGNLIWSGTHYERNLRKRVDAAYEEFQKRI